MICSISFFISARFFIGSNSPSSSAFPDDIILLSAESFSDDDGDEALAAHWIVYENCDFSSNPVINEFVNMENWYYNENSQESIDLTELPIYNLSGNSSYCWKVRYRDTSLGWSEWSEPVDFQTGESQYSENLLFNSDFKNNFSFIQTCIAAINDLPPLGAAPR